MTTATATLTNFLLARISDDEAAARDLIAEGPWNEIHLRDFRGVTRDDEYSALHIGAARVLADCAARRAIVELHAPVWMETDDEPYCLTCGGLFQVAYPCDTLRQLAAPYSSHPDFRAEWAVD